LIFLFFTSFILQKELVKYFELAEILARLTSVDEHHIGILYEGSRTDMTFQIIPLKELIGK